MKINMSKMDLINIIKGLQSDYEKLTAIEKELKSKLVDMIVADKKHFFIETGWFKCRNYMREEAENLVDSCSSFSLRWNYGFERTDEIHILWGRHDSLVSFIPSLKESIEKYNKFLAFTYDSTSIIMEDSDFQFLEKVRKYMEKIDG